MFVNSPNLGQEQKGPKVTVEVPPRLWTPVERRVRQFVARGLFWSLVTHREVSGVFWS